MFAYNLFFLHSIYGNTTFINIIYVDYDIQKTINMCGRFVLASKEKIKRKYNFEIVPSYNIAPGSNVLILDNNFILKKIKWGFSPEWSKTFNIINARIETLEKKSVYKNSLRCVFLADGYYEWKKENDSKQPYYHYFSNKSLLCFAGIFNYSSGACVVTMQSQKNISHIHNRQPLILKKEYIKEWLKNKYDSNFKNVNKLKYHKVKRVVNSPFNNSKANILEVK